MATPPKKPTDTDSTPAVTETAAAPAQAESAAPAKTTASTPRKSAARKPVANAKKDTGTAITAPAPRKPAKPRATTTTRAAASSGRAAQTGKATPSRATGKAPATPRKPAAPRKSAQPAISLPETARTSRWGLAAMVGGIAAIGAAVTGALFALRGSTPVAPKLSPDHHAHQADGTDSSASFEAGIADEGTIPE